MIVSLAELGDQYTGDIVMREVDTEEEAFAEMRRFLEVNNIPSNVTSINWIDQDPSKRYRSPHKSVGMGQAGYTPRGARSRSPEFHIYYGNNRPAGGQLRSYKKYGLVVKTDSSGEPIFEDGDPVFLFADSRKECIWYLPLFKYLADLKERTKGGE